MKITDIKTWVVGTPPPHFGGLYWVFLKLTTDSGVEGYGEVYGVPFGPHVVADMIEDTARRFVIGEDPFKIERMWRRIYGANYTQHPDLSLVGVISGLEMACWDIVGKELDKPVYELLGGQIHEKLRSYTYLYPHEGDRADAYSDPAMAAERAAEYVKLGFTAVKFDPVGGYSAFDPRQIKLEMLDHTEKMTAAIREAVGTKADLLFGTHGQMTAAGAIRLAKRLEKYDPLWFEEPTPPENANEMARVARQTSIPVATGERLATKYDFQRVLETQAGRHPADGDRPGRRYPGRQEDRKHGRSPLRPDRPAYVLWSDQRRGGHSAIRLQPQFPDPGKHSDLGRVSCRDPEEDRYLGGRVYPPADRARAWCRVG